MIWEWQGQSAAELPDMVKDVATALHFIHANLCQSLEQVIVGGYSSGGHVLASLLEQSQMEEHGIHELHAKESDSNAPKPWISGIFYLSGVLSVDSWLIQVLVRALFASPIPSPLPSPGVTMKGCRPHPCLSTVPHLVLGCRSETFGIPILDSVFCAKAYAQWLTEACHMSRVRCVLVDSNHWSILSSHALATSLQEELLKLCEEKRGTTNDKHCIE